jgi:hypothetical protein
MYTRNLVILANSVKYTGHCIAGKDLDTGEWIRLINSQPRPFFDIDLEKLYGDPAGPSLLSCVKIPFQEKVPLYYQPENELITGDPWEKMSDYPKEKLALLEDTQYPCWLGNHEYGNPDNIPASICNPDLPLPVSLHFKKLSPLEHDLTLAYKPHENGYHPRLVFYLNFVRYDLGITDFSFPRLSDGDDTKPRSLPESYVTLGVGQLFETMNAHYKLAVGIINSGNEIQELPEGDLGTDSSAMVPITDSDQKMTNLHVNTGYKNFNQQLFLKLKNLRQSFADQAHIPPFRVFSNQSLREMAQYRPCDPENFINISGVGEYKLKKYGPAFTSEIIKFCEENGIEIKQPNLTQDSKIDSDLEQIYRLNQEILSLNDKLKELTSRKNDLLNHAINSGIKQQGDYLLLSSISSVRQLNLEAFKQLYPQVFMEIGSVKLSDADKILGKAEVTDLCTLKESIKYSVKKMNPDTGMQEKTDE